MIMAHINKQIVNLKHRIERIDVLRAEKKALMAQIEMKQANIEAAKASIDSNDQKNEGLTISMIFERFRKSKKDEKESKKLRVMLEIKQMENDLRILQGEYDRMIDQLKEDQNLDLEYKKLMEEKRMQVGDNQNDVFSSLESVIEKCRLENIRMNEAIREGERVLIQLGEMVDTYIHSSDQRVFESRISKNSKQFDKLEEMQLLVARIKRELVQFERVCARCDVNEEKQLSEEFIQISDEIIDSYLMDFFFEDERKKLQKAIYRLSRAIAGILHDLEIRELANQNKIIEMLDCINAL